MEKRQLKWKKSFILARTVLHTDFKNKKLEIGKYHWK